MAPRSAKVAVEPEEPVVTKPDDEIEVVADNASLEATPEVAKPDEQPKTPLDDVDAAVTELKQQLENERIIRVAAQNEIAKEADKRQKAEQELTVFRSREHENNFNLVSSQLDAVTKEADNIQAQLATAFSEGDHVKAATLQRQLSRLESRADQLEQGRDALEARKVAVPDPETAQPVKPSQSNDPVGDYIRNLRVSDTDKAWLDKHRDAITDTSKWSKLTATAAYALNNKGLKADTPEYYSFLEGELGYAAPVQKVEPTVQPQKQPNKSYSAPVSREGTIMSGERPRGQKIRLSAEQRDAAKASGLTDVEYAKNLISLAKEGKIPESSIQYVN